jgi:hypothetical protein
MASSRSTFGQAEIVVVELEPAAFFAAIQVERLDLLAQIGQLAKEEMPAAGRPANADW